MSSVSPVWMTSLPSARLRPYISHYWLSIGNQLLTHTVLPNGVVDVVTELHGQRTQSLVYGGSTRRADVALALHSHYLGVRFRPGQSRHFLQAAAKELTDRSEPAAGLLSMPWGGWDVYPPGAWMFARLDALIEAYLAQVQPLRSRIDDAVALIGRHHGQLPVEAVALAVGRSRRQFERAFLDTVGMPPKLFSLIRRYQYAAQLMQNRSDSLAEIALAAGYADQSHLSHDFKRWVGRSPADCLRNDDAFLQDPLGAVTDDGRFT